MMVHLPNSTTQCCPYVEDAHPACSSRFTLSNLELACSVCFGKYQSCSVYRQFTNKQQSTLLDLTVNNHVVELRPTGS